LSRKEREDNHPLFDQKKGAKFIDDFKRLAKGFPEAAAKVRELTGAARRTSSSSSPAIRRITFMPATPSFPGRLSEREINVYLAAGNFRSELAKKYAARHGAFGVTEAVVPKRSFALETANLSTARGLSAHLGYRFSDVRVRLGHASVGAGASSVHFAA
jgi:hypothetical protein